MKIAKIVNTHGLKGQLKLLPVIDNNKIFHDLKTFEISGYFDKFECEKITKKDNMYLLKILGYDDINQVEKFKGKDLFVEQVEIKLEEGQYLVEDLIGSKLLFEDKQIGIIKNVVNYGASDIFVFEDGKKEMSVPFVDEFFDEIDVKNKTIVVNKHFFEGVV